MWRRFLVSADPIRCGLTVTFLLRVSLSRALNKDPPVIVSCLRIEDSASDLLYYVAYFVFEEVIISPSRAVGGPF